MARNFVLIRRVMENLLRILERDRMTKFVFPKCALCCQKEVSVYDHSRVLVMVIRHVRSFMDPSRKLSVLHGTLALNCSDAPYGCASTIYLSGRTYHAVLFCVGFSLSNETRCSLEAGSISCLPDHH